MMEEQESAPGNADLSQCGCSIVIRHNVLPSAHNQYEDWLKRIIPASASFPGHQGAHIVRPPDGHHVFEIAVRFSSDETAQAWLASDTRRELMDEISGALASGENVEIHTGIDFWFTPPSSHAKQPTRWKQWLITTAVIWPLTMVVPWLLGPVFDLVPALNVWGIRHGLVAAVIVALVVYLIMPRVVRLVAKWLFH